MSGRKLSDNIWAAAPSPEDNKEECHDNDDNASVVR